MATASTRLVCLAGHLSGTGDSGTGDGHRPTPRLPSSSVPERSHDHEDTEHHSRRPRVARCVDVVAAQVGTDTAALACPLRWRAIAAVPVPHRYLLLLWAAWFVWSGSGPPPLLWRAAASVSVLSQVRWYSMDDYFFYAAFGSLRSRGGCSLPLRLLRHAFQVCVAYFIGGASRLELYGLAKKESLALTASRMLFSGCLVPFRRAEAAPLLPSTAQPNYWPLPVSEGIGGGLESGGIGTPEGRGMQQERIEKDGDIYNYLAERHTSGVDSLPKSKSAEQWQAYKWPLCKHRCMYSSGLACSVRLDLGY